MLSKFIKSFWNCPFAWLFYSLVLTISVYPILRSFKIDLTGFFLAMNLISVLLIVRKDRGFHLLLPLVVVFILMRVCHIAFSYHLLLDAGDVVWIVCCIFAANVTRRYIFSSGPVTRERLFAALDLYLLAGIVFGMSYRILDYFQPSSFNISQASSLSLEQSLYFSFVTIATLGYGDIVPISAAARALAVLEAVGGQIYLAVLVAKLVSLYSKK